MEETKKTSEEIFDKVISGTFYAKLKADHEPNKTIEITEGRFDFNKKAINTTRFY